ncbi:hypothetical protein SAMN05421743_101221 [Thalassobacillus cyri]|uniref:Uncharacterized protein n=1 Tax=Thalassobacillus cyri TaxID=571932 RepID=A0A1H3VZ34_9BACI|nr:hypothetical protein [Thalassobacillus cyri]SDZ79308.1 hypothetical protein SAMN05421743_101221 [Thalassobacillus cyri]
MLHRNKNAELFKEVINQLTEGMEKSISNHFHSPEQMKEYLILSFQVLKL